MLSRAHEVAAAIGGRWGIDVDAAGLLTGRAALRGLTRAGRVSPGGATRLLAARDGWCALTLSRADDLAAVPALLQVDDAAVDPWPQLRRWAATRAVPDIVERAALLDIPAAGLGEATAAPSHTRRIGPPAPPRAPRGCWWPICPRCGRDRCAVGCWPTPGRRSSRSKALAARTAPAPGTEPSSTG